MAVVMVISDGNQKGKVADSQKLQVMVITCDGNRDYHQ
jgi:hypothetical protein